MSNRHGRGPKDVFVPTYSRWKEVKREKVRDAHCSKWTRLSVRASKDQLDLGSNLSAPG